MDESIPFIHISKTQGPIPGNIPEAQNSPRNYNTLLSIVIVNFPESRLSGKSVSLDKDLLDRPYPDNNRNDQVEADNNYIVWLPGPIQSLPRNHLENSSIR